MGSETEEPVTTGIVVAGLLDGGDLITGVGCLEIEVLTLLDPTTLADVAMVGAGGTGGGALAT